MWVDTSSRAVRDHYAEAWRRRPAATEDLLRHYRLDPAAGATDGDYVAELIKLFRQR